MHSANLKKEEWGEEGDAFYLLITLQRTLWQELLCALVDVMLTCFDMHEEFPNPVCRCLRFHH